MKQIRAAHSSVSQRAEARRRRLERACQLICDRHRQDGRKDKEQQFRRMELKARAYRRDADIGTRLLTGFYDFFSDFGRSFFRPIRGLAIIWFSFFLIYWGFGASALDLTILQASSLDLATITDAALLASDKSFPFGASVDESKLFDHRVVGEDGGFTAVIIGILGALQTV